MIKKSPESGHGRNLPQHNKGRTQQTHSQHLSHGEKLKAFPLRSEQDLDVHSCHYYST